MGEPESNTLGILFRELALALKPLVETPTASNSETIHPFLELVLDSAGVALKKGIGTETIQSAVDAVNKVASAYQAIAPIIEREELPRLDEVPLLGKKVGEAFAALQELSDLRLPATAGGAVILELGNLGQLLAEYLIADFLEESHFTAFALLVQLGAIKLGDPYASEFEDRLTRFNLPIFIRFFTDPKSVPKTLFGWGDHDFQSDKLLAPLVFLIQSLGFPAVYGLPEENDAQVLGFNSTKSRKQFQVMIPLVRTGAEGASLQAGFAIVPLQGSSTASPGFGIVPYGVGETSRTENIGDEWGLDYQVAGNVTGRYGLVIRFNEAGILPLDGGQGSIEYDFRVLATILRKAADGKVVLFAQSDLGVVEAGRVGGTLGFRFKDGDVELIIELVVREAAIVLRSENGDGFLQKILPKEGIPVDFDLALGWSNTKGLYFRGGAGLEATLPVNIDLLGILKIPSVYLSLQAKNVDNVGGIEAIAATTVTVKLGPITATVEQMGLQATLSFPPKGGNLGVANLSLGFKPPKGVGLSIDAEAVVGEGYLFFDPQNEQYAGVLQLEIAKKLSVTAVGLLTTRMPDGSKGFSLLIIISIQFEPAIELGYGFTLSGLGGLVGINRTACTEVLRNGLRAGTLGSIMFPKDPVKNAPQIVSNLAAVFPPAEGRFLFGPMAILGWGGTPPLVKLELGIVLELPEPVRLIILGRLRVQLPNEKEHVVKLQLDALGVINFQTGEVALDAVLYDSSVGPFTVTGEMALRANFGAKPEFLLSVGGFHPGFQAPAGFPPLERVAIALSQKDKDDDTRLQLSAYFALTSNTIQFGAHIDLFAKLGDFSVTGQLGFDALIHMQPFGFIASFGAMMVVKAGTVVLFGIDVQMNLTGPSPWHAWGKATFTFLGFPAMVEFSVSTGEEAPPPLPPSEDVFTLLLAELQNPTNWSSQLPSGENPLVTFGSEPISPEKVTNTPLPKKVLIHPLAELQVSQRLVPLEKEIYKFGNTAPAGASKFTVTLSVGAGTAVSFEHVEDWFAPAQFEDKSDAEKLTAPSFELMQSGTRLKITGGYTCGTPVPTQIPTAKVEIAGRTPAALADVLPVTLDVLHSVASIGAAGKTSIRSTGSAKYRDPSRLTQGITLKPAAYRVVGEEEEPGVMESGEAPSSVLSSILSAATTVGQDTMAAMGDEPSLSYSAAREQLAQARGKNPKKRMWVVPDIGMKRGAG